MRNTHTTLLFTLCGLLFYGNGSSQIVVQEGNIAVQVNELAQRGDSLYVKMDVSTTGHNVASRKSAEFTPVLSSEEHTKELPAISVMGRNSYKNYRRSRALLSRREHATYDPYMPYAVIRDYKGDQTVKYALAVPYEPWMSSAQLTLLRLRQGSYNRYAPAGQSCRSGACDRHRTLQYYAAFDLYPPRS